MLNKNERMEKLNRAGINTDKYFTINVSESIPAGAKIHVIIDENGQPMFINANDSIAEQIIEDGYVRNTKLHRRFVMAQMFYMLNYVSYYDHERGYNACLRRMYSYGYTFKMMLDEVKVLSKLEERDRESFEERSHFFTREVIVDVMKDYIKKLESYIDTLPSRKCKGVPYKRVKGVDIFVDDLQKKLYRPLMDITVKVQYARSYAEIYRHLNRFMYNMVKIPNNTPKSPDWIDAYKGEGAYYTLKNLIMFHNCGIRGVTGYLSLGIEAMNVLNAKLDEYQGEGWRMFALMKKVIEDNDFNFYDRMRELNK